ncbi:DUF6894 family protein [Methylorubrum aminovorans]
MRRYFFDIHDGYEVIDRTGRKLSSFEAAKSEAMSIASGHASDPKMLNTDGGAIIVVIRDGPGSELCTIRLVFNIDTARS